MIISVFIRILRVSACNNTIGPSMIFRHPVCDHNKNLPTIFTLVRFGHNTALFPRLLHLAVFGNCGSDAYHMDKGKEEFKKFSNLLDLLSIEIYGEISDSVLERLHQEAQMLGDASVTVHNFIGGFNRIGHMS